MLLPLLLLMVPLMVLLQLSLLMLLPLLLDMLVPSKLAMLVLFLLAMLVLTQLAMLVSTKLAMLLPLLPIPMFCKFSKFFYHLLSSFKTQDIIWNIQRANHMSQDKDK